MNDTTHTADPAVDMAAILRRVEKLLKIAQDGRANPHEAAAAAQQAEKIMRKYQLAHADVIRAELKTREAVVSLEVFASMKRDDPKRPPLQLNPTWAQHLAVALARLNDCEATQGLGLNQFGHFGACLLFHGYKADAQVAQWMFDYLVGATIAAVKRYNAERKAEGRVDKAASSAFRSGFMTKLTARIYMQAAEKKAERDAPQVAEEDIGLLEEGEASTPVVSTALALFDAKAQAIKDAIGEVTYKESAVREINDRAAYIDGMRRANAVDLNTRGIGGTEQRRHIGGA